MKLIATKPMTYATRRLQAGDQFEAGNRDGRLLIAIKKAKLDEVDEPVTVKAAPKQSDISALREEYKALIGKAPFNGWKADQLREKIAAAKAKA